MVAAARCGRLFFFAFNFSSPKTEILSAEVFFLTRCDEERQNSNVADPVFRIRHESEAPLCPAKPLPAISRWLALPFQEVVDPCH